MTEPVELPGSRRSLNAEGGRLSQKGFGLGTEVEDPDRVLARWTIGSGDCEPSRQPSHQRNMARPSMSSASVRRLAPGVRGQLPEPLIDVPRGPSLVVGPMPMVQVTDCDAEWMGLECSVQGSSRGRGAAHVLHPKRSMEPINLQYGPRRGSQLTLMAYNSIQSSLST